MVGDNKCNAKCKYCISRITYGMRNIEVYNRNIPKVKQLAHKLNITTAIITGKGEPTLLRAH